MATTSECPMSKYFHWNLDGECILFMNWRPQTMKGYLISAIFLILVCLMREFLIYYIKYYEIRSLTGRYIPFWPSIKEMEEMSMIYRNPLMTKSKLPRDHWRNPITLKLRMIDCVLYGISLTLGYGLMLVIMTFNIGFMIIIVCGYCLGRFIFTKQTKILSRYAVSKMDVEFMLNSDHCRVRS